MGLRAWDCQGMQLSISELSVVGGGWVGGGGRDKRTSWSDLVGVRQKQHKLDGDGCSIVVYTYINMQLKSLCRRSKGYMYLIKIAKQATKYVAVCNKWAMLSDKKVESRKWTAASGIAKRVAL